MEPEGSLLRSQVPATCPYPEPTRASHATTSHFLKIHLNIIFPSTPRSQLDLITFYNICTNCEQEQQEQHKM